MESLKLISLCSTHDSHELIRHKGFFFLTLKLQPNIMLQQVSV